MCRTQATRVARVQPNRAYSPIRVLLSLAALVGGLAAQPAFAGVGIGVAPTYPTSIQVGDTNVPVGLSIVNTSTAPESGGTLTLGMIKHTPSCGVDKPVPCPPANADPGVFLIKGPATGMTGTACAGTAFTIGAPDPTTGEVEFIPGSPVILAPVGAGAMASCTINFLVDVLAVPTHDASPNPGIQTDQLGRIQAVASVNMANGFGTGSGLTTLVEATPTPTESPTLTVTPTETPSETPTPTMTPSITQSPTKTPAPSDCCECVDDTHTCSEPNAGQCNLICASGTPPAIVPHAVCVGPPPTTTGAPSTPAPGGCATFTPTPSPTATQTPECLFPGDGGLPDLIPGYCGPLRNDCVSEICMSPPQPKRPNGLPDNHPTCNHDNPLCDAELGDEACTFTFKICFNMIDLEKRFICTGAGPVTQVALHNPLEGAPRTSINEENRDAFEAALVKLGGAVVNVLRRRLVQFNPPLAAVVCTDTIPFKVALRQNSKTLALSGRSYRLNWHTFRPTGRFDGDHLYLRCNP